MTFFYKIFRYLQKKPTFVSFLLNCSMNGQILRAKISRLSAKQDAILTLNCFFIMRKFLFISPTASGDVVGFFYEKKLSNKHKIKKTNPNNQVGFLSVAPLGLEPRTSGL